MPAATRRRSLPSPACPQGTNSPPQAAYFEAEANLGCGRLSAAEARLEATLERGGPDLDRLVPLLIRVYQLQARFDDVRRVLRRQLGTADPPLKILRELDNLNRGRHAYDGLRAALERAGVDAPDDDRVWLGRGRLAIALGRWDEAADWLGRCLAARADAAVWRARLDWAMGAGRPDEVARALNSLGPGDLDSADRLAARAWLVARREDPRQEREALEGWLAVNPVATRALDRLAELAHRAGEADVAARLRRREAEVDRAIERYRTLLWGDDPLGEASGRLELARAAEAAGYRSEARAVYAVIVKYQPDDSAAREAIERLDRAIADRLAAATAGESRTDSGAASGQGARDGRPLPSSSPRSPTMLRPSAFALPTSAAPRSSASSPSSPVAGWGCWTTMATAGSTSIASRAAPFRPAPTARRQAIGSFATVVTAPSRTLPTALASPPWRAVLATA